MWTQIRLLKQTQDSCAKKDHPHSLHEVPERVQQGRVLQAPLQKHRLLSHTLGAQASRPPSHLTGAPRTVHSRRPFAWEHWCHPSCHFVHSSSLHVSHLTLNSLLNQPVVFPGMGAGAVSTIQRSCGLNTHLSDEQISCGKSAFPE